METKAHIMYVEGDEVLGFVTKDNLEERGYTVIWAQNGQEGYEKFHETENSNSIFYICCCHIYNNIIGLLRT